MQRFYRSSILSIAMCVVLVSAQLMYAAQAGAALRSVIIGGAASGSVDGYAKTEHGRLIKALWGYANPAALELLPVSEYEFDVLVWADDPLVGQPVVIGVGEFEAFSEHEFDYLVDAFAGDSGYVMQIEREIVACAGVLRNAEGDSAPLVGMLEMATVSVLNADFVPVHINTCIVGEERPSIEDAVEIVDGAMENAGEKDPKGGTQVGCVSDWVGDNGVQCCMVAAAYRSQVSACFYAWLAAVYGCLITAGSVAGGGLVFCLRDLKVPIPAAVKLCCLLFIAGAVGALVLCIGAATAARLACEAYARAQYCRELIASGCGIPPEDEPPCYGGF